MHSTNPFEFWLRHVRLPVLFFVLTVTSVALTHADMALAQRLFFDAARERWLGTDSWWINEFIHTGGRWLVRLVVMAALILWGLTFRWQHLRHWRRPAAYFATSTVLTVGIVGLLKQVTNVDCPWDLLPFGGHFPYVSLFADRPNDLRAAHCFPAAHASSGYALMTLYFMGLERGRRWARSGLTSGVVTGLVFGLAQQARGAHFLSHDLWSALLAWCIPLSVYCFAFGCRLWEPSLSVTSISHPDEVADVVRAIFD